MAVAGRVRLWNGASGRWKASWVSMGRKEDFFYQINLSFRRAYSGVGVVNGAAEEGKLEIWLIFSTKLMKGLHVPLHMHADVGSVAIDLVRPQNAGLSLPKTRLGVRIASLGRARLSLQSPPSVPLLNPLISSTRSGRGERERVFSSPSSSLHPSFCTPFLSPPPCTPFLLSLLLPTPFPLFLLYASHSLSLHPPYPPFFFPFSSMHPFPPPCRPYPLPSPIRSSPFPPAEGGGEVKVPASGR